MTTAIVWFRRDLRLADNAALAHALQRATRVVPVYIHAPEDDGDWPAGAASRWWLHHSLTALRESVAARGSRLVIRKGPTLAALRDLIRETGATLVCFNRLYEPARLAVDRAIERKLTGDGVAIFAGAGELLAEPWSIASQNGSPYRVYTPYARKLRSELALSAPLPTPRRLPTPPGRPLSRKLRELELLPDIRWDRGLGNRWQSGELGAQLRLRQLHRLLPSYAQRRDLPAAENTTQLSPHLHFGEVTPRQVWQAIQQARAREGAGITRGAESLERELLWREFAHHVLHHFPHTPGAPLDARFAEFPWRRSKMMLRTWQRGETGIPIVDAGMRELWTTGFMHNRVRMIVASFLTKHLRLDWRQGAHWFWDTLVDADLANNTLNWQWVAGCGADAAPYFRIFNPVLQSRRFDPEGDYLRRWLPELRALPPPAIHAPWLVPPSGTRTLRYPVPQLDLASARAEALAAFHAHRATGAVRNRN